MIENVKKRTGEIVAFDSERVKVAIQKAFESINQEPKDLDALVSLIIKDVEKKSLDTPNVEDISDVTEMILMQKHPAVAKSYILFRDYKRQLRDIRKVYIGSSEKSNLTLNAIKVLEARYLLKDNTGNIIETPNQLFDRVAEHIARADKKRLPSKKQKQLQDDFYDLMYYLDFLPNTPTLMNAGTELGQLSACFVLPVGDSISEIFDSVKFTALIHQSGGGTGFSFSRLRSKGSFVKSTKGVASGPISFMRVFDAATDVIKQGGKRRGANMGILRVDHPDILEFISCKQVEGQIANFNISVAITDTFMKCVENNIEYDLIDPHNSEVVGRLNARSVFDLIANMAWQNGEPGIIFIDEMNRHNQVANMGTIEATNPCGEQALLPYESCNLGSINLANMVDEQGNIDWKKLEETTRLAVRFLDNVIDMNKYPLTQIESMTKSSRKIGLGVMGWADMLLQLKIPYNSDEGVYLGEKIMKFINDTGTDQSVKLGEEKGNFPAFKGSYWDIIGYKYMRNSTITTVAPTGTISMIADASGGIEPQFSLAYTRLTLDNQEFIYTNKYLENELKKRGLYTEELMVKIAKTGMLDGIEGIPDDIKRVYVTSREIETEWHIKMQAAFQQSTHNAVSKTINMPNSASIDDVKKAYKLAYELKCKGLTIYRDASRQIQVLTSGTKTKTELESGESKKPLLQKLITKEAPKDECPICHTKMHAQEGCYTCTKCAYSKCS
jgi:ribonucleoside-diphosphate reductase alpha chain